MIVPTGDGNPTTSPHATMRLTLLGEMYLPNFTVIHSIAVQITFQIFTINFSSSSSIRPIFWFWTSQLNASCVSGNQTA